MAHELAPSHPAPRAASTAASDQTQFIHGAPVQKQRVSASRSIIIIVVSTRSIVDVVFFGVIPLLLPAERVGGEVHARSIASESPHPSIPPLHRRPRMGSIPAPLEAHATIIILVIAFIIIVIVVIGIAIIATIAVVASIKQLVDIQHAADRRDEDDRPVATPAEILERFPGEEGTGYAVSDIVGIVSPTAATAATAARRRRRVATEGGGGRREASDVDVDDDDDDAAASPSRSGSGRVTDENSASQGFADEGSKGRDLLLVENNFF